VLAAALEGRAPRYVPRSGSLRSLAAVSRRQNIAS
jgi:hypothetical protein